MRKMELNLLKKLEEGRKRISDISADLGISKSYASKLVDSLEKANLLKKSRHGTSVFVENSSNPKAILMRNILKRYNCKIIFSGKREIQLTELLEPASVYEIVKRTGMSTKAVYNLLRDLSSIGIILENDGKYFLNPGKSDLIDYIKMIRKENTQSSAEQGAEVVRKKVGEILKKLPLGVRASGVKTAFSAFPENGISIFPKEQYFYFPTKKIDREEIFVHSIVFSRTKQDMALSMIFYLKNKGRLEIEKIKQLSRHFDVSDIFLDVLAYLDKNPVKNKELFLP